MKSIHTVALVALLAAPSFALQGSDSCATPTAIAGQGVFAFDNSTATTGTEGQLETLCYSFGTSAIDFDVWFEWTSDMDGVAIVTTCNGTTDDTKLAAYPGGACPAQFSALACNDDTCGYQSSIEFTAVTGSTYLIQLGNFPGASPSAGGTFQIIGDQPVLNPTNGHYYDWISVGAPIDWDIANLQAQSSSYLGMNGHLLSVNDVPEHLFVVQTFGQQGWLGLYQDHNDPSYSEPSGGFVWTTGEPVTFTPWGGSEPNNANGNEDFGELTTAGSWNDMPLNGNGLISGYYVEYEGSQTAVICHGDGSGTACPCGNMANSGEGCANGTGSGGVLGATGSSSVSIGDLVLNASQLIPSQPGLYFQGNNAINSGLGTAFGDGLRCAGGGVVRLQVRFADSSGSSQTSINIPATGGISAGDLKRFQVWYRDPDSSPCGALFNLTNGVEITFST